MLNLDKVLENLSNDDKADALKNLCINKQSYKRERFRTCAECEWDKENTGDCVEETREWLLKPYSPQIDWSHSGAVVVICDGGIKNNIMNGDIYVVNGSFMGKLYLIDTMDDLKQTIVDLPSNQTVPKSVLVINDKLGLTYKYYECMPIKKA